MPRNITVTFSDGTTHVYQNAPDDVTPDQVTERARSEFGKEVASLDGGRNASSAAPASSPQPEVGMEQPEVPSYITTPEGEPYSPDFAPMSIADLEAARRHAIQNGDLPTSAGFQSETVAPEPPSDDFFRMPRSMDEILQGLKAGTGDIIEGVAGIPAMFANPIAGLSNEYLGTNFSTDQAGALRDLTGIERGNKLAEVINEGAAGGLGFSGAARAAGNVAGNAAQRGLYELGNTPIRDMVAGGAASAASELTDIAGGGEVSQALAGIGGAALGYKAAGLPQAAMPAARQARFVEKQMATNPFAAYDAEIVDDMVKARKETATAPTDPQGRAELTAKTINNLEQSYFSEFKNAINAMPDLSPADKIMFKKFITDKFSIPQEKLNSIRGTIEGDAIADAVTKVQRLRALTPELKRNNGILSKAADIIDFVPVVPGIVGRSVRAVARAGGDGEAARVNAADRLIAKEAAYKKLGLRAGPSGQRESQQALYDKVAEVKSRPNRREQAALARAAAEKLKAENARVGVANDLDNIRPGGGYRGLVYNRTGLLPAEQDAGVLKMLAQGKITPEQFDMFLKSPDKLMKGNAGNAISDRLEAMIEEGTLKRDPKWTPSEAPAASVADAPLVDAQGQPIRSLPAYQGGIQKNIAREMALLKELDEVDPVISVLGEGPNAVSVRASETPDAKMTEAERTRAAAIRAELAAMKQPANKPKQ